MQSMAREAIEHGCHVVCIGPRGQQGIGRLTSHLTVVPGRDSDVREVVDYVHGKFCQGAAAGRKLFAAGYSIGGNMLAKMIGVDQASCKLTAAFCCHPPMKYWETVHNMKTGYFGLCDYGCGKKTVALNMPYADKLHEHMMKHHGFDVHAYRKQPVHTISSLEEHLLHKLNGNHASAEAYRLANSSSFHVSGIKIPTFFYFSLDDPMVGENSIDFPSCLQNPHVVLGTTEHGGHLGCFERSFSRDQWMTPLGFDFIKSFF